MVATTLNGVLLTGDHASRPAASAVAKGTLYRCTTHSLVYQSDGSSWSTWASLAGTGLSDPMTTRGDIIIRNASNVTARLGRGSANQVLTSDGTDVAWAAASGGSATDPTIPSGGTLYDGSSTSGWTSFGTPDTFDANTTAPGCLYVSKNSIGNNLVGAYRATGTFPKTYTMKLADALFFNQYNAAGIIFAEASPGKLHQWGIVKDHTASGFAFMQRYAWTNPTSASANTDYPNNAQPSLPARTPIWLRLIIASSTDVTFQMSMGGFIYKTFAASVNPGFTIGNFGFGMSAFNAIPMSMAVDWIHES